MKLITIITLIILIALMGSPTNSSISHNTIKYAGSMVDDQYTIKEINSIACDYSFKWTGSTSFLIHAGDYYNSSGVDIFSSNDQYNFNLCWKPYSVYALSEVEIRSYHSGFYFSLNFGVKDSMYLFDNISGVNNITKFQDSKDIGMGIYWNGSRPYVAINKKDGEFIFSPPVSETPYLNSSVTMAGNYYSLNVSMLNSSPLKSLNPLIRDNKFSNLYQINTGSIQFAQSKTVHPVYDKTLSIFIMPSQNGNVYTLNPFNHRMEKIYNYTTSFNEVFQWNNYVYMICFLQKTMAVLKINESDLNIKLATYNASGHYFISMYHGAPHIFFRYYFENLSSGKITDISYSHFPSSESFYEQSTSNSLQYFIYENNRIQDLIIKSDQVMEERNFTHIQSFFQIGYGNNGPIMEAKFNNSSTYIILDRKYLSFENITMYQGGIYMESNLSETLLINGSYFSSLPIPMSGFSGNLSHGIAWSSNSFYLYGNFLPEGVLNLTWKNEVIRHSGYLNFTVLSNTSYRIKLNISMIGIYYSDSGSFFLNLSGTFTGRYIFSVTAENSQGLIFSAHGHLYIDNSIANISFNRSLSKGVFKGESILISATDSAGISQLKMEMHGEEITTNLSSINFTVPDLSSYDYLNFTVSVKDKFNFTTIFPIVVKYYGERNISFRSNIHNGDIINHNLINVAVYSREGNISYFTILFKNLTSLKTYSFQTSGNEEINLSNGKYYYEIFAVFIPGNRKEMENGTIVVNSQHPSLQILGLHRKYFSHITDSPDRFFNATLQSSMNGTWYVKIIGPGSSSISMAYSNRTFVIPSIKIYNFTSPTGVYRIFGNFTSFNGFNNNCTALFVMNNTLPDMNNSYVVYTNHSIINLSEKLNFPKGYYIQLRDDGEIMSNYTVEMNNQGNHTLDLKVLNKAMAYCTSNITVVYSRERPEITVSGFKATIYNRTSISLAIRSSWIPMKNIRVNTSMNYSLSFNKLNIFFHRDGLFNFTISVENMCGNYNSETYEMNVFSFPYITHMKIEYRESFQNFNGQIYISGYHLDRLKVLWIVDGKEVKSGREVNSTLQPGMNSICVQVQYSGGIRYENLSILAIPMYAIMGGTSLMAILFIYRFVPLRFSLLDLGQLIINSDGMTVRKLTKIIRKKHFSKRRFNLALKKLKNAGYIRLGKDLNGDDCIKVVKHKKK